MTITLILIVSITSLIFAVITSFSLGVHVALVQKNNQERVLQNMTALHNAVVNMLDKKLDYLIEQQSRQDESDRR